MGKSSIGFGHNPFGNHQFGSGDWAEEVLWKLIPEFYRDLDEAGPPGSITLQPLRGFIDALKPMFQELRLKFEVFPTLWDANTVPLAQLPALAYNVGITDDPSKSEGLRRSSVLNASQLWLSKGTVKGYQIAAAFEGLLVVITPLWAETCAEARQRLGTVGAVPASFDLSTTRINERPVAPETLHITVTTALGLEESIRDDGAGKLFGEGFRPNGPLTRLNVTSAMTLNLTNILGLFKVGDTITQGPNSGTVLGSIGSVLKVGVTVGSFTAGPINDITSGASATVVNTLIDSLVVGESVTGLTSGTTAVVRSNQNSFVLVDKINTGHGFTAGETLVGQSSNQHAIAGSSAALLPGPLRTRISLSGLVGAFVVSEQVTGGTSGSIGIVRNVGSGFIDVDTITAPGFTHGETVTGAFSGATAAAASQTQGTINYLTGELTGTTTLLAAGSRVDSVVDLVTDGPDQFVPTYDSFPADALPLDNIQSDRYALWPLTLAPVRVRNGIMTGARCRSYSLRLHFLKPDDTEIENFLDVATRITAALETFRPLHVRFDRITFDGSRASSQVWRTNAISAENSAVAAWTATIVAEQMASSQVWTAPMINTTVAS